MSSRKRISRNDPCPCGSGKKYKRCCLNKKQPSSVNLGTWHSNQQATGAPNIGPVPGKQSRQAATSPSAAATPSSLQVLFTDAITSFKSGQYEQAKRKYEEILRISPKEVHAISGRARCLMQLGQSEPALEAARRAVELAPDDLICVNELTVFLFNLGKVEESLKWAKRAVKLGPDGAKTNVIVANCYEKLHKIEEALEANKLAQIANPQVKYLKFQEAKLRARNGELERASGILEETTRTPGIQAEVKTQMFGELGRILDKLGKYGQAYEAFAQSGLEASRIPAAQRFSLGLRPALMDGYIKGLTKERLEKWNPEDLDDNGWTPAFLVGFPRSGTTMTEQILAAHSSVLTTDEQPYLEHVRMEWARIVGANPDIGKMADQLDKKAILRLRQIYREKVEADQNIPIGTKTVIDKLPLNIIKNGLINLIFPESKIIVALRDPRDACLSCFIQDFELNSAMIHFLSLENTVHFYTQVMETWIHFRDIITTPYITVRYEDTVRNLELEAKRLIHHLNLEWEPGVLQFHQKASGRVISTPSYAAVTEPVHTRAIGRWKNYREQFSPLLPVLEPLLGEFGYEVEA